MMCLELIAVSKRSNVHCSDGKWIFGKNLLYTMHAMYERLSPCYLLTRR